MATHETAIGSGEIEIEERILSIGEQLQQVIASVQELSMSQKDTWNKIPLYALLCDGKSGYSGFFASAYNDGLWCIHGIERHGYYTTGIDLDNGRIVSLSDPQRAARNEDILTLATLYPDSLNAQAILERLHKESQRPFPDYTTPTKREEVLAWQVSLQEELGLGEVYTRRHQITAEEMSRRAARSLAEDMAG